MITFNALLYNATEEEFVDFYPVLYSLGWYTGDDLLAGISDGTDINDMPRSDFSFNTANNIGRVFEEEAKRYYLKTSVWPILKLYKNSGLKFWIEWNHSNPTGFDIYTDATSSVATHFRWEHVLQWSDNIPTVEIDGMVVLDVDGLTKSCVFVSEGHEDDLTSDHIVWSGAVIDSESGYVNARIGYATMQIAVRSTQAKIVSAAGEWLASFNNGNGRVFRKRFDGPALGIYTITGRYCGPTLIVPSTGANSTTVLKPYDAKVLVGTAATDIYQWSSTEIHGVKWGSNNTYHETGASANQNYQTSLPVVVNTAYTDGYQLAFDIIRNSDINIAFASDTLYVYLHAPEAGPVDPVPPSDVDPEDIPPEDQEPEPIPPDDQDPYYDPTSDPENPQYDPTKDPESPDYDPTQPATPYRPPSEPGGGDPPTQETQDPITPPATPPSYVTTNAMFTLYNPSGGDLTNLANFLWSPTWSIDTFKKIFANPLDCILGLMVMPHLSAPVDTKTMNVGNISTGVTMHYFTSQFFDFDCGTFDLLEYYASYLDYAPYTRVNIFLPYIGDKQLSTDEVMNKTLGVKYRFDLATGDCVAFITVDGSVLYSFSGNCAARLPLAGNNWNGIIPAITGVAISAGSMAAGLPALGAASAAAVSTMKETISHTGSISGSAGLMGIQTPYLIVTRPRQALPRGQNSFTGYPSFMTESLGSLTGYTEVEQCHLEHVPATGAELEEIERLLKEGVLF